MDTFRILMVLPSVFTRGWNPRRPILTQKPPPGGGSRKPLFWGSGGPPPPPPGGGEGGGTPLPPLWGAPPRGGSRTPPLGYPKFIINLEPNSCKEITRGEARYRFSTHSPVPCQR